VSPKSSATEAETFLAVGPTPIENYDNAHNVTELSFPAVESTSEKLNIAEHSKKIGVEVTTDL
jgi:hypothetical protein